MQLVTNRVAERPPVWKKNCSFGLLCVSFENVNQIVSVSFYPFCIKGGIWDVIVLISDHCLSVYLGLRPLLYLK